LCTKTLNTEYLFLVSNISRGIQEDSDGIIEPLGTILSIAMKAFDISANNTDTMYFLSAFASMPGKLL